MSVTLETELTSPSSPLEKEIAELGSWFHNLHMPDGTQTAPHHPLGDFPLFKWKQIAPFIPEDISGWKVLDIGCNAGFYSFELAKRGADVLGLDLDEHYLKQARWAARKFNLQDKVEFRNMQIYDLINHNQKFELVLFMGVFYHLRYPLLALDIVAQKFTKLMIFQTMTMPGDEVIQTPENINIEERDLLKQEGWPKMAFIENEIAGDKTNWWAPNDAAVQALLRSAGLEIKHAPAHEIYICTKGSSPVDTSYLDAVFNSFNKGKE
jgi:tRNA (mo5U34)-methyltransferase